MEQKEKMWMDEPHVASSAAVIHIKDKITGRAADANPIPPPAFAKNDGARDPPAGSALKRVLLHSTLWDLPIPLNTLVAESTKEEEEGRNRDSHNGAQMHIEIVFSSLWNKFCNLGVSQSEG